MCKKSWDVTTTQHWPMSVMADNERTHVVHCKREPYDVYVGRPSKWGNPFQIGRDGTREEVIACYRDWVQAQPALLVEIPTLRGKTLGCWCAPNQCHGDVLAVLADTLDLETLLVPRYWFPNREGGE